MVLFFGLAFFVVPPAENFSTDALDTTLLQFFYSFHLLHLVKIEDATRLASPQGWIYKKRTLSAYRFSHTKNMGSLF